jgi:radical SAM protein with 4Fe4S-binding SPASM domain
MLSHTLARNRDRLRLLGKLTPRRAWNMAQVHASYWLSRRSGQPNQWGLPIALSVEPTTSCNLRCPECPSGLRSFTRPTGMLGLDLFKRTIDELHRSLLYLTLYFQGEPYLHPEFLEMVRYAADRRLHVSTSTNAHYLTDDNARKTIQSGLDRLIISIDGTTQEVYEQYRVGGKLSKVLEGTRNLVRWKRELKSATPHVVLQFLVVRPNEHQIDEVYRLGRDLGVDEVALKTAQIYDYENGSDLIPTIDKYSRYAQRPDGTYRIKNELSNHCWRMWNSCVMTWDGRIVPCCFDKDADHQLGTLQEQNFRQIWFSQPYRRFRQHLLKGRSEIDICQNCTEGMSVWKE